MFYQRDGFARGPAQPADRMEIAEQAGAFYRIQLDVAAKKRLSQQDKQLLELIAQLIKAFEIAGDDLAIP